MFQTRKKLPPISGEDLSMVRDITARHWQEARKKSFFLTGGTGFFGTWLVETFIHINNELGLDANLVVLSRDPAKFLERLPHLAARDELTFIKGDVRNFTLAHESFDYIIHAATDVASPASDPSSITSDIVSGTERILQLAETCRVRSLLLVSSGAAYGPQPADLAEIPEEYSATPTSAKDRSAYGEGKLISEYLASAHSRKHGYDLKIARCFAFVGPHLPLDSHFAIGNFIRDCLDGESLRINGNGTPLRSYLYASDLAAWLWVILFKGPSHRMYNVGSSEAISIADLARLVNATLGNPLPVQIALPSDDGMKRNAYIPSTLRSRNELGLLTSVSLEEAIIKTARWHQLQSQLPDA